MFKLTDRRFNVIYHECTYGPAVNIYIYIYGCVFAFPMHGCRLGAVAVLSHLLPSNVLLSVSFLLICVCHLHFLIAAAASTFASDLASKCGKV